MQVVLAQKDRSRWLRNAGIFLAPLGILYLAFVQVNIRSEGFQWEDFVPTSEVVGGGFLYLINTSLDYLRKLRG